MSLTVKHNGGGGLRVRYHWNSKEKAVADPGFRRRGAPTPEFGVKPTIWQDFCRKLHGNERNWTERERQISANGELSLEK